MDLLFFGARFPTLCVSNRPRPDNRRASTKREGRSAEEAPNQPGLKVRAAQETKVSARTLKLRRIYAREICVATTTKAVVVHVDVRGF